MLIRFRPLLMERVWGGQRLAEFGKELPPGRPIGESWELVDRPEAESRVVGGPLDGISLGGLWSEQRELFGARAARGGDRFPLLIKLLDAREALSVQVHPPAGLGGEPKTEAWFVAAADPGAHLLVGLRRGVDRARLEAALAADEDVAGLLHRVDVAAGDTMLIPSGRAHAIGPGCLIVEVQQSSDTTHRVYDYGRIGLDGRPRELHVEASLASIDFDDVEPGLAGAVVSCPYFEVAHWCLDAPRAAAPPGEMAIVCVVAGRVGAAGEELGPGDFALVPAPLAGLELAPLGGTAGVLQITLPDA